MKILVIDDHPGNIASAKVGLAEHEVITASTISGAIHLLRSEVFDFVMTDMWMPPVDKDFDYERGAFKAMWRRPFNEPMPVGLTFALLGLAHGSKVLICSDENHHSDRFAALMDVLAYEGFESDKVGYRCVKSKSMSWDGSALVPEFKTEQDFGGDYNAWRAWFEQASVKDWRKSAEQANRFSEFVRPVVECPCDST